VHFSETTGLDDPGLDAVPVKGLAEASLFQEDHDPPNVGVCIVSQEPLEELLGAAPLGRNRHQNENSHATTSEDK
jgi:hypothetical protein